ncbi:MAG: hypothetical protein ACPKOP_08430 [Sphaerochaetaceae bacterium]
MGMIDKETLDSFISSLSLLDEQVYFEMAGSYLGKIPTPFDKQKLHLKIASVFHNEQFISNLITRLDEVDLLLVNAAYFISNIGEETLISLFKSEHPYGYLKKKVVNLEERLILVPSYTHPHKVCLNQLLLQPFEHMVIDRTILFPSSEDVPYVFSSQFPHYLQAVYSIVIHNKKEKAMRENLNLISSKIENLPFAIPDGVEARLREVLLSFSLKHGHNREYMSHFFSLDIYSLLTYVLNLYNTAFTSLFSCDTSTERLSSFFRILSDVLDTYKISDETILRRGIGLCSAAADIEVYDNDEFFRLMTLCAVHRSRTPAGTQHKGVVDSDFTFTYHPGMLKYEYHPIHYYARITSWDVVVAYTIDKNTIFHAFDYGFSVDQIIGDLDTIAHNDNQLLKEQIEHFRSEYDQIRIYDGITVCVDERLERIIEGYHPLNQYVIKKLAAGVFLFNREQEIYWKKEFDHIGIFDLPRTITGASSKEDFLLPVKDDEVQVTLKRIKADSKAHERLAKLKLKEEKMVDDLKTIVTRNFPQKSVQEELLRKIEEKIIVLPSQIEAPIHSSHIIQASGFDFSKKIRVIKTALDQPDLFVEIKMINDEEEFVTLTCDIISYSGNGDDGVVVVRHIPQKNEITIPVGKIFMIRTIRKSIFF